MDNSQSFDVFSENENFSCNNSTEIMEEHTYETLVEETKLLLSKNPKLQVQQSSFPSYFLMALHNCKICVFQSLDQVISLLSEAELAVTDICNYLENAVTILRLLCTFITSSTVELVSMNCVKMRTFPICTGNIILTVFSHCKDSESIYGPHLKSVERQLKDLFRNCHELQLTYLMVLDKQFIFNLSNSEELDVLVEALEINLRIGEIVQTLDVKTMAEQWKAYTMICEKYALSLKDTQIYENCTKVLCYMIQNNIGIAMSNQEEKIMIRSLKVASFTIKILMRVCNIFKLSPDKNYEHIVQLLLYIYQYNPSYLESSKEKSPLCLKSVSNLIFNPAENLVNDLLQDEKFFNGLSKLQIESLSEDQLLSYILLIVSAAKYYTVQGNVPHNSKKTIIDCIFKWLPYGHIWLNLGLKFQTENTSLGLYEHLLTHTFAMSCTLTSNEFSFLEQNLYESILGIDCYCALFSTNLWELLAKSSPRPFVYSQLLSLCKTYKKLENHKMFTKSPQKIHLSKLIGNLFRTLHIDDKMKVYKQFDPTKEDNFVLWTALRIDALGCENNWHINEQVEISLREKLKEMLSPVLNCVTVNPEFFQHLINLMKLIATGHNVEPDLPLQKCVTQAWTLLCPKYNRISLNSVMNQDSVWYLDYIQALVTLTQVLRDLFLQSDCGIKVLHVISNMIDNGPTEIKLMIINLLFNTCRYIEDENRNLAQELLVKIFRNLLLGSDDIVKSKMYYEIRNREKDRNLYEILSELSKDEILRKTLSIIAEDRYPKTPVLKNQLSSAFDLNYIHKCLDKCVEDEAIVLSDSGTIVKSNSNASNNFDFVDMDTLFESESDSEPASKRAKLDSNEAEEIIKRLEEETSLLCNVKENIISSECKIRIRDVCERLLNIID